MVLKRHENDRFSDVTREWEGMTAVVLGGGPSLTLEQIFLLARNLTSSTKVIAVNDAYLWAPFADVLYAADEHWWDDHKAGIAKPKLGLTAAQQRELFELFPGLRCTIQQGNGKHYDGDDVHVLRNRDFPNHSNGLSLDPGALVTGSNGGFQALNLAILAGAKKVLLLGIDGKPGKEGQTHWSGGHRLPTKNEAYQTYRRSFSAAAPEIKAAGVRVINCSPDSAVDCFEKGILGDALLPGQVAA